jgi:glycosyltransferase involved in cell wall biosynthesis
LDIVGDGDQRFMFEQLVNSLWLWDKIHFVWYKDRTYIVNEFLPMIDILVNASYQEGLPTSVLEWLLSGCVVVATDVWGTVEISDQKDLILVKKWDVNSLKIWLEYAIQHYESIQWLSRQEVQERFDRNKNIEKYRIIMW